MRYLFNFSNAMRQLPDTVGGEFASLEDAVAEGRASARELLSLDHGEPDASYFGAQYVIVDPAGQVVAVIDFEEALLSQANARVVV
ncbi:hypothetical protein LJR016_005228 [Devosia sp. LjRoot16]|jgi:hypothetical protein|uniref:DUF6894 family protein n=1 Tax=Devosia sp. LjRoot16 TaxID=3342271 RepID=UPI003ECCEB39